eukprot:jgi/Tetstr1/437733/TSEL_026387.t1
MERLSRPMFKWPALGKPICTWPRRTVAGKTLFGQAPDRGYDPAFVRAGAAAQEDGPAEDQPEVEAPSVVQALRDVFNKRLREYVGQRRDNQTLRTEAEYNEAMPTLRTFEQTMRERGDINVPLEQVKLVSHAGMVVEHIRDSHLKGVHAKLHKLHKMILGRYCNIPRRVVKLFCETCVTCAKHRTTKAKAGHRPILSKGMFGACGQIDLIDY